MALRNIRLSGDPILRKKSREVSEINERVKELTKDMLDTMYHADGVGLAAPQIGILRRIIVIDIGDGPIAMVNPIILEMNGTQIGAEGCLSVPGVNEDVERPNYVKVEFINLQGKKEILIGEELLARAICHEIDHLEGTLFTDKICKKGNK